MRFRIKAVDAAHSVSVTTIEAPSEVDARRQLADRNLQIISIARDLNINIGSAKKFPVVSFSQELVALLDAGLTLVEAIDTLTEKETNASIRVSLDHIRSKLYEGRTLSHALEQLPSAFPPLYVATVRASEKSGAIREAIMRFVTYQLQIDSLRKKVVSASIYPAVLCVAGFAVTLFLLGYVVPRFSGIYEDLGSDIPASSKMLMHWGQFLQEHGLLALFVAVALLAAATRLVTRKRFRAALANTVTRIPVIGQQVFTYQLARLYRTVGMLLSGGTPATTAFRMSRQLLSEALRPNLDCAIRDIGEGKSFTRSLEENELTTPVASRMLRVGEKGGNMGEMMERISAFYDDELERSVDILTRLIEPVLMLIIGLVIGFIVVLMYFPIFELAGSIQ